MAKVFTYLVLLSNLSLLKGNEELGRVNQIKDLNNDKGSSTYSYGYDVSDSSTGDIKSVWESMDGNTVKGHYSVLEPDGSIRTVEYSAGPGKGFIAAVNNDGLKTQKLLNEQQNIQHKSYREYNRPYDISDETPLDFYPQRDRNKKKRHYDFLYKDYSMMKPPSYSTDSESTDFSYNPSIKHIRNENGYGSESHSHIEFGHNPNCKSKHTKDSSSYHKASDGLDFRRHKYPILYSNSYDKYSDSPNDDSDKYLQHYKYKDQYKSTRPDEITLPSSIKYNYPVFPDMPASENIYQDDVVQRPKKKNRPNKNKEVVYSNDDLGDYVLVPRKKIKKPPMVPDITDYYPEIDDHYDYPDDEDDRNHKPFRVSHQKEVVRKIIKKKRPTIIKLLDILDI